MKLFWEYYGFEKGLGKGMGRVKRDMSMFFVVRIFDCYFKFGGRLVFFCFFYVF